jgi:hypothetical protein
MNAEHSVQSSVPYKQLLVAILFCILVPISAAYIVYVVLPIQYAESNDIAGWAFVLALLWLVLSALILYCSEREVDNENVYAKLFRIPDPYASVTMFFIAPLCIFLAGSSCNKPEVGELKVYNTGQEVKVLKGFSLQNPFVQSIQMADTSSSIKSPVHTFFDLDSAAVLETEFTYKLEEMPTTYQMLWEQGETGLQQNPSFHSIGCCRPCMPTVF